MNVSKSGAILPLTFCVVSSVSLSTLTTWTLKSTPIAFAISLTRRAAVMLAWDSDRTYRLKLRRWPPFSRMPSPPGFQPAASSICFAFSGSYG